MKDGTARNGFARDAVYLTAGSLAAHAFLFLLQILLARNLAADDYGRLSFFMSTLSLCTLTGTLGIAAYLPAVARRRDSAGQGPPHSLLMWACAAAAVLSFLYAAAWMSGAFSGFRVDLGGMHALVAASILPVCLVAALQGAFVGFGKTRLVFRINLGLEALKLAYPIALIYLGPISVRGLVTGWLVIQSAMAIASLYLYLRWARAFPQGPQESRGWSRDHWEALAYLIPSGATVALPRLLVVLTGAVHSAGETAALSVALIFMSAFGMLLGPYQTAFLRHFQDFRAGPGMGTQGVGSQGMGTLMRNTLRDLGAIILLAGTTAWLAGGFLIAPLFGTDLAGARNCLGLLALIFAMDAPRAFLDVFFVGMLPKRLLITVEAVRLALLAALFLAVPGLDLQQRLLGTAMLCAAANAFKAWHVVARLRHPANQAGTSPGLSGAAR